MIKLVLVDIRLSLDEIIKIENYLSEQLKKLHGEDTKIEPYDSLASLCDLLNDVKQDLEYREQEKWKEKIKPGIGLEKGISMSWKSRDVLIAGNLSNHRNNNTREENQRRIGNL